MVIITCTHVIVQLKLKNKKGLGRLATLASCRVGLPPPQGLGRLAAAGLVPWLACRRPRVRQARHAGLVPRRLAAAHSNSNNQCLCSKHGFSNPTKQMELLSFFLIFVFSNIFTNANRNKTVPVLNNIF